MKPENIEKIRRSFETQAPEFESKALNFSKEEYLDYALTEIAPAPSDDVLEVAAGTCACGRSFASRVRTVVCLDATPSMLEVGRRAAENSGLGNMVFVRGYAEELPFLENSFTIVFSRLAFHHFADAEAAFSEMARVLKPGGKLAMIDMEAAEGELREVRDEIETLRDPSHVRNLRREEMKALFSAHGMEIEKCGAITIPQRLESWLSLTKTPRSVCREIRRRMQADIDGGKKTGFCPYIQEGDIFFPQRWVLTMGRKGC